MVGVRGKGGVLLASSFCLACVSTPGRRVGMRQVVNHDWRIRGMGGYGVVPRPPLPVPPHEGGGERWVCGQVPLALMPGCKADRDRHAGVGAIYRARPRGAGRARSDLLWANLRGWVQRSGTSSCACNAASAMSLYPFEQIRLVSLHHRVHPVCCVGTFTFIPKEIRSEAT